MENKNDREEKKYEIDRIITICYTVVIHTASSFQTTLKSISFFNLCPVIEAVSQEICAI